MPRKCTGQPAWPTVNLGLLDHVHDHGGSPLGTGGPGTGKSAMLREASKRAGAQVKHVSQSDEADGAYKIKVELASKLLIK
jgi:hypothetical protein